MRTHGSLVIVPMLVSLATSVAAQSVLQGRVVTDSGKPIAGAEVTLTSIRYSVRTDSLGRFSFSGTPGSSLDLSVQAAGFNDLKTSVVLGRDRPLIRDFVLSSGQSALPESNPSNRVLRGQVATIDGDPISFANITVNGGQRIVSDDSGRFSVPGPGGSLSLIFRRIGFAPEEVRLPIMPDTTIRVRMNAVARTLPGQIVTGRTPFPRLEFQGFYKRMGEVRNGARVGYFVTPEDLALRNPQNVTDAVEQFPSIRLAPIDDGAVDINGMTHADGMMSRHKFRIEDRSGCPLTVYLDRVRIQPSSHGGKQADEQINAIIQPGSVAGIEVYPRAMGAPAEFPPAPSLAFSECGVVLIWTR